MLIEVLKSKIHRVTVMNTKLHFIGNISLNKRLVDDPNLVNREKVQTVNVNDGERLKTYIIEGKYRSLEVTLNTLVGRKVQKEDIKIIVSYAQMETSAFKAYNPNLIFSNEKTNLLE